MTDVIVPPCKAIGHVIRRSSSRCIYCGMMKAAMLFSGEGFREEPEQEGVKFDDDKPRMDLLPADVLLKVAEILTHGAQKYGERNWEKGMKHGRLLAAALRHISAYMQGEDVDKDSKLHPIDHAITNLMMLRGLILRNKGNDSRK